jgi:hypothetical protein
MTGSVRPSLAVVGGCSEGGAEEEAGVQAPGTGEEEEEKQTWPSDQELAERVF